MDFRGRVDDADSQEVTIGLGCRQVLSDDLILGGYGFFDRLRTDNGHYFNQATLGVEALITKCEARVNGYLPESGEQETGESSSVVAINGANT